LISLYKYSEHNDSTPTYDGARDELSKRDALDQRCSRKDYSPSDVARI